MTDKEIIDGIDVSECYHLKYDHIGCDIDETYCLGGDCYFKQLKRKEQECEELKQWKKDAENLFKTQTDNADKIINKYKQALKKIDLIKRHH